MTWLWWVFAAWFALGIVVGVPVGFIIRAGDDQGVRDRRSMQAHDARRAYDRSRPVAGGIR